MSRVFARAAIALTAVLVGGLAVTASASAQRSELIASIDHLSGSHGYRIWIDADRVLRSHKRGRVTVGVTKGNASSLYYTHGVVTKKHLRANLGSFGRISLRFHPHSRRRAAGHDTKRADPIARKTQVRLCVVGFEEQPGTYQGTISFQGEDGYTQLETRSAKGFIGVGKVSCSRGNTRREHGTVLGAKSGSLEFEAANLDDLPRPWYVASEKTLQGDVHVFRSAGYQASADAFTFEPGLSSAHVAPPRAPFSGSADFASPNLWTGSLSVDFPGAPDVPLTGPGFKVTLKAY